tara:strand:- start:170 stop:397 length:228 start_codon:yes stop_codon:yes gene_type:complete
MASTLLVKVTVSLLTDSAVDGFGDPAAEDGPDARVEAVEGGLSSGLVGLTLMGSSTFFINIRTPVHCYRQPLQEL